MCFSKLPFIAALLLIASTLFAADVPKTHQIARFIGADLPEARIHFAKKGTTADLAREILSQVKIPTSAEIILINLGGGKVVPITEDTTYNVDIPFYQPNRVVIHLKMPFLEDAEMGIVQIKDEFLKKNTQLAVPKSGKVIDIMNAYKQKVNIPENMELIAFYKEGGFRMMKENDSYTTENLSNVWLNAAYKERE